MKYELYIYDPLWEVGQIRKIYSTEDPRMEYTIMDPVLTLKSNSSGSLKFTIPVTNALYGTLRPMGQTILVKRDNETSYLWAGRLLNMEEDMYGNQSVYFEGALSYLNDTIQPPSKYEGTVLGFVNKLLNEHNSKVSGDRKILAGSILIAEKNDSILRYTNYESTWECFQEKLLESYGGYIYIRMQDSKYYLDWIPDSPHTCSQDIVFGTNLIDYTRNYDWDSFLTVVVPKGVMLEESPIDALYAYLTVKDVNNGSIYVESPEAIKVYGRLEGVVEFSDITTPQALLKRGEEYLSNQQFDDMTITLNAVDLHLIDSGIESFDLLDKVEVVSAPHGLKRYFVISEIALHLDSPEDTEYILGNNVGQTLSQAIVSDTLATNSKIDGLPTAQQVKNGAIQSSNSYTNAEVEKGVAASGQYTDQKIAQNNVTVLEQARQEATEIIKATGFEGYVTVKKNEQGLATELLICNDPDYTKATKLWRWNSNGLGYSSNGYNGPYETAWTIDGTFVADFIKTGTMLADRIKGGVLEIGGIDNTYGVAIVRSANNSISCRLSNVSVFDQLWIASLNNDGGVHNVGGQIKFTPTGMRMIYIGNPGYDVEYNTAGIDVFRETAVPVPSDDGVSYAIRLQHPTFSNSPGTGIISALSFNTFAKDQPFTTVSRGIKIRSGSTDNDIAFSVYNDELQDPYAIHTFKKMMTHEDLYVGDHGMFCQGPFVLYGATGKFAVEHRFEILGNDENPNEFYRIFVRKPMVTNDSIRIDSKLAIACQNMDNKEQYAVRMECNYVDAVGRPYLWFIGGGVLHDLGSNSCGVIIEGNLQVAGSKNRIVETESYGKLLMSAQEAPEPRFSDYGSSEIGHEGSIEIRLDPMFLETIEVEEPYQVFITRTSEKETKWVEKKARLFIVHGDAGATFDWMVSAIQKDYANIRFEKFDIAEVNNA